MGDVGGPVGAWPVKFFSLPFFVRLGCRSVADGTHLFGFPGRAPQPAILWTLIMLRCFSLFDVLLSSL